MEVEIIKTELANTKTKGNVQCGECNQVVEEDGECLSCDICKLWYHNRCNKVPLPLELYNLLSQAPDNIKWFCDGCLDKPKWKRIFESSYSDYEEDNYSDTEEVVKVKKKRKRKTKILKKINTELGVDDHHSVERGQRFSCDVCKKTFMTLSSLLTHKRFHSHTQQYVCNVCNKGFPNMRSLLTHKQSCSIEKPFVCAECGERFNDITNLERHSSQHKDKPHKCVHCGTGFSFIHELKRHLITHRTGKSHEVFSCSICERKFLREENLKTHMLTHSKTGGKVYECEKCSSKFNRQKDLKVHKRIHNIKEYICDLCGDKCSDRAVLQKHTKAHSNENNEYSCSLCDYKCSHQTSFRQHMIRHCDVKPFACTLCEDGFFTQPSFNAHMHKHSGTKLYICEVCGKDCKRSHILKVHMASHSGEEIRAKKANLDNSNSKENISNESKSILHKEIEPATTSSLENNNATSNPHKSEPNLIKEKEKVPSPHVGTLITGQRNMLPSSSLHESTNEDGGVHMQNYSNTGLSEALSTAIRSQNNPPYYHSSSQNTTNKSASSQNLGTNSTTNSQNLHQTNEPLQFVRNTGRVGVPSGPPPGPAGQYYNNPGLSANLANTVYLTLGVGEMESRPHLHHLENVHQFH